MSDKRTGKKAKKVPVLKAAPGGEVKVAPRVVGNLVKRARDGEK